MDNKSTKPKTFSGWRQYLTACHQGNAEASKNLENVESRSVLLVRGRLRPPPMAGEPIRAAARDELYPLPLVALSR
ncbi:MAG: hypothetical protein IJF84_09075 [Thermoguttaceae bacterium]|nr:hypothetical protein [Thermoguttaceae bacterium]